MSRTRSLWLLTLAVLLGSASMSEASFFFCRRPCYRVAFVPICRCGIGFLRIPDFVRCYIPNFVPPVVAPAPPPVLPPSVPPMPAPAPVAVPKAPIVSVPSKLPPAPPPASPSVPLVPGNVSIPAGPMTHQEFAASFRPLPGRYEVVLLHPGKNRPVTVAFTLPNGNPQVHVLRRELIFDYGGGHEVAIRFQIGGRVRVTER